MKIYFIGVGLGNPETMTMEARWAAESCPVLIGAPRLLDGFSGKACFPLIAPEEIAVCIASQAAGPVGVLFSGDVGFYSGAKRLRPLLEGYEVISIPGISSLAYFCAKLGISWQDAHVVSAHGRDADPVGEIQRHEKTFVLTGGKRRAQDVCRDLCARDLGGLAVAVGENLSYPNERIVQGAAVDLLNENFGDLAVILVENPRPVSRPWSAPGLPDEAFLRGDVPMTKSEIRTLALSKLRLEPGHVLWDVGAGTGSVSVEGALSVPAGRVFAVEQNQRALALLEANKKRFFVQNLEVIAGTAPDALLNLPAPNRVFLGGTGGRLREILSCVFEKNPEARIVLTAVTLETLGAALACWQELGLADPEILQVAVTKAKQVGRYHMPDARNPVWLLAGEGRP